MYIRLSLDEGFTAAAAIEQNIKEHKAVQIYLSNAKRTVLSRRCATNGLSCVTEIDI